MTSTITVPQTNLFFYIFGTTSRIPFAGTENTPEDLRRRVQDEADNVWHSPGACKRVQDPFVRSHDKCVPSNGILLKLL